MPALLSHLRLRRLAHWAILLAYLALLSGPASGFVLCTDGDGHVELELVNKGLCVLPGPTAPDCDTDACVDHDDHGGCCLDCHDFALGNAGQLLPERPAFYDAAIASSLASLNSTEALQLAAAARWAGLSANAPASGPGPGLASVVLTL